MPDQLNQLTDYCKHKCSKKDLPKVKSDRCDETQSGGGGGGGAKSELTCKCGKCFQLKELVELYQHNKDGASDASSKYKMAYVCLDCKFKYDPNRQSSSLISYECTPALPKISTIETIISKQIDRGDNSKILDAGEIKLREAAGGGGGGGKSGGCGTPCKCPTCKCEGGGKDGGGGGKDGGGKGCGKNNCNCDPCGGGGKKEGGGGGGKAPLPCNCTDCKCEPCKDPSKAKKKEGAGADGCKCGDCCKCTDCEYKKGDKKEAKEEAPCTCKDCTCPVCTKKGAAGKDKKEGGECTCKECSCPVCTKKGDDKKAPPKCPPKPDVICDCVKCNCLVCPGAKQSKADCSCPAKLSESRAVVPAATSESKKSIAKPTPAPPPKADCVCKTCICIKCPSGNVQKDEARPTSPDKKDECKEDVPTVNATATPMSAKPPETSNDPCDTEAPPDLKMGDCEISDAKPAKRQPKNPERNFGDSGSYHKCCSSKNLMQPINHPQLYMCSLCNLAQSTQQPDQKPTHSNEREEDFLIGYCTYCSMVKINKLSKASKVSKSTKPARKRPSSFLNFARIPPFEPPRRLLAGSDSCACCVCSARRAASASASAAAAASASFDGKPPAYHSILKVKSSTGGRAVCKSRATETEESKRRPRRPGDGALRKVFVKKERDFDQTFSKLALAYRGLVKKGKAKDEMITGLSEMLETLGASSTKECLMRCTLAGSAPDYDRCADSTVSLQSMRLSSSISLRRDSAKRSASLDRTAQQSDDVHTRSSLLTTIKHLQKQYEMKDYQIKKAAMLLQYVILMNKLSEHVNFTKSRMKTKNDRRKENGGAVTVPLRGSTPYIIVNLEGFSIVNVAPLSPDTLVVEWSPPDTAKISGYDVLVDGKENHMIMNGYRTCTLIEGLDLSAVVSIAVYAVTVYGRCEPPATAIFEPCTECDQL
ncbi:unnamed protein product [Phyllotreta striolata]|uniref:Fibronectin type-III domain-containing protein n=1 Tax=Phyllotreta striolata TaxID=444603 RepID=A0A9N9XU69_PHYSR|nr:unnamed protein product [Phyllotreta striolata]